MCDVHADDVLGIDASQIGADHRSRVVADGAVSIVAESRHQLGPGGGDPHVVPASIARGTGESEPRNRRDDEVKRIGATLPVRHRIGQRPDHVEELDDRARPPMGQDQRKRVRLPRSHVQEMDALTVDRGLGWRALVEARFPPSPFVAVEPVVDEMPNVRDRNSVVRAGIDQLLTPTRPLETTAQVVEVELRDFDSRRANDLLGDRDAAAGHERLLVSSCSGHALCVELQAISGRSVLAPSPFPAHST